MKNVDHWFILIEFALRHFRLRHLGQRAFSSRRICTPHINLIGFVAMFLTALYYRAVPEAAELPLARYHVGVSIFGAFLFPIGIACVMLGGHDRFEPVVVAGALIVLLSKLLFVAIVFRTSGGTRRIEKTEGAARRAM